jgi:nucleoside transporter
MRWSLRIRLSLMMFLEFAIWGAWAPVLWPYLVGKPADGGLGFSDFQAGWMYNALWLACMVAPFIGGQIVDRWIPTQWFLAAVHFFGGILMLTMAQRDSFATLMPLMLIYCLLYAPTLALTASLCFHHLTDPDRQFGPIRVLGTIGWIVAGLGLTFWRTQAEKQGVSVPADMLLLAGWASFGMAVLCCFLPHTPPQKSAEKPWAFVEALRLFKNPHVAVFLLICFVVTTELQFYYLPTAEFLEKGVGIARKNVPATMTIAQLAEMLTMGLLLGITLKKLGMRKTLAIGVIAWPLRYVVFALYKVLPESLVVASLALHGLGYTFFFVVSQIYIDRVAPKDIKGSAQSLLTFMTLGVGNFLGVLFTSWIMTEFTTKVGDQAVRDWKWIFLIPCFLTVACAIAFLVYFKEPPPREEEEEEEGEGEKAPPGEEAPPAEKEDEEKEPYEEVPPEEPPAPEGL